MQTCLASPRDVPYCDMGRKSCVAMLFVLLRIAGPAMLEGEPLPKIALRNAFRDLTFALALGMEQAPDGSGRVFVLEQDGIISVVSGNEDGFASSDFLNISDRKPHTSTED